MTLEIFDVNGKLTYSESGLKSNVVTVDRSTMSAGVYFVKVRSGDVELATEKLLVN
ncbi:MAG TPA: T9SS type A sorting domain-containing protein [Bacteroidia bacterium]|nr:T9SS type A sorting domain-containing protein [Bacteroidia bacterium]